MQRSTTFASTGLFGLLLMLVPFLAGETPARTSADRPIVVGIERVDPASAPEARQPAAGPRPGIRLYGTDGIQTITPEGGTADRVDSPSQRATPRGIGVGMVRKISGASMAGSVTSFAVSPDGQTAVYIADQDVAGRFELYSTPVDGSAVPTKISTGLVFGAGDIGVSGFQISPGGADVAFLADPTSGGGVDDIYSVPIDGVTAPVRLNGGAESPVTAFGFTPDSANVAFFGTDTAFASGGVELHVASTGVAASANQVSDASDVNPAGNVISADFSSDSATMIYAADATSAGVFQWFSVPVGSAGPGSDVQLSAALGSVGFAAVSPDSATVVYTGDDTLLGVVEVFAAPIGGGAGLKLNPSMAGGASGIEISPDSNRVGYLADQNTAGVTEVYGALIGVAGSGTRLNTAMSGTQLATTLNIGPDSFTVLYEADQDTPGTHELYSVPIDASAGPTTLQPLTAPDNVGFFTGSGTPVIGRRAVYPVFGNAVDLYSVPFDGSVASSRLNDPLAAGETVFNGFAQPAVTRLMAYGFGSSSGTVTEIVEVVPIRRDLATEQMNVTAGAGADGVLGYVIASSEDYGVYVQDQETNGKPELYSRELDSDADTVINAVDNCPFVANMGQGAIVLGQTVTAVSNTEFAWSNPAEVRYVRGPLGMVDVYATDDSGTLADATSHIDATMPTSGAGLYYLFASDCSGRSYQNVLGAEPGRDLAAFP